MTCSSGEMGKGPKGDTGDTPYQEWRSKRGPMEDNSYKRYLEDIKGPKGDRGDPGASIMDVSIKVTDMGSKIKVETEVKDTDGGVRTTSTEFDKPSDSCITKGDLDSAFQGIKELLSGKADKQDVAGAKGVEEIFKNRVESRLGIIDKALEDLRSELNSAKEYALAEGAKEAANEGLSLIEQAKSEADELRGTLMAFDANDLEEKVNGVIRGKVDELMDKAIWEEKGNIRHLSIDLDKGMGELESLLELSDKDPDKYGKERDALLGLRPEIKSLIDRIEDVLDGIDIQAMRKWSDEVMAILGRLKAIKSEIQK